MANVVKVSVGEQATELRLGKEETLIGFLGKEIPNYRV